MHVRQSTRGHLSMSDSRRSRLHNNHHPSRRNRFGPDRLIRMLCCPFRSPFRASRRFPGGISKSVNWAALCRAFAASALQGFAAPLGTAALGNRAICSLYPSFQRDKIMSQYYHVSILLSNDLGERAARPRFGGFWVGQMSVFPRRRSSASQGRDSGRLSRRFLGASRRADSRPRVGRMVCEMFRGSPCRGVRFHRPDRVR